MCPKRPTDANELDNEEEAYEEDMCAMIYDDTDLESEGWPEDELICMAEDESDMPGSRRSPCSSRIRDDEAEGSPPAVSPCWEAPPRHRRTRRAHLHVCDHYHHWQHCGCDHGVPDTPASSFEVLANSDDSDDASNPDLTNSSSDGGRVGATIDFESDDSESDDSESEDRSNWMHCCPYRCTTRKVPCRRVLMERMLLEMDDLNDYDSNDETEDVISKVQMLRMKIEKEEKIDVAPLLHTSLPSCPEALMTHSAAIIIDK
jgi:hypothetical protein